MNTGIYRIINVVNGKFYIGSTATLGFQKRWYSHLKNLKSGNHPNQHLQHSWNKHGEQNFKFEILEHCLPNECITREQYYFNTLHPHFNILTVAGSVRGYRHTSHTKALIGAASAGENHPCYSGEHRFYNPQHGLFEGSIVNFRHKFNLRHSLPYKLTQGILSKSHGWIYLGKIDDPIPNNLKLVYNNRIHNDKPSVTFIRTDGEIFTGTRPEFIKKYGLDRSAIAKIINGKRKMAFGWSIKTCQTSEL
jgi:group I intron endonuclease